MSVLNAKSKLGAAKSVPFFSKNLLNDFLRLKNLKSVVEDC